jgi:hypothetical protein
LKVGRIAELAKNGAKEDGALRSDANKRICLTSNFITATDEAKFKRAAWLDIS